MRNKPFTIFGIITVGGFLVAGALWQYHRLAYDIVPLSSPLPTISASKESSIVGGIVPHHLTARPIIDTFFTAVGKRHPRTIVVLSPDHFGVGHNAFVTIDRDTLLGVPVDTDFIKQLSDELEAGKRPLLEVNNEAILHDHGITNLLPFISARAAYSAVLPVLISPVTERSNLDYFLKTLTRIMPSDTVVVASTDFSHYLSSSAADFHDAKSIAALSSFSNGEFKNLEVDCWQCLYLASAFAEGQGSARITNLAHSNSAHLLHTERSANETTSYVSLLYDKGSRASAASPVTLLGVGDIMVGRNVEDLLAARGEEYPFEKIRQLFRGVDRVIANLEGPILATHVKTPAGSTTFSFIADTPGLLRQNNVDLVSLANNHTFDHGAEGFTHTRQVLEAAGVTPIGNPKEVSSQYVVHQKMNGKDISFLAFNDVFGVLDEGAVTRLIKEEAVKNPAAFIIVVLHWGDEYQLKGNKRQEQLAHAFIDAGADLIMGAHPHVVEHLEVYKNRMIFYSLGNFIFDQYFSKDTQEGLTFGLTLTHDTAEYRLFPIEIIQSQPRLMTQTRVQQWLSELGARSDVGLRKAIESGIITVTNN